MLLLNVLNTPNKFQLTFFNRSVQLSVAKENSFECTNMYTFDLGCIIFIFNSFTLKVLNLLR